MARERTKQIVDIPLSEKEVSEIKKGYKVFKNGYCLYLNNPKRRLEAEILSLTNTLKSLRKKYKGLK